MKQLKQRWNIDSNYQLFIIFIVFAITGSTSAWLSEPVCSWLSIDKNAMNYALYLPLRLLLIFPIYQVLLVAIGWLFGQFTFFWNFEKKMLDRLGLGFLFKK